LLNHLLVMAAEVKPTQPAVIESLIELQQQPMTEEVSRQVIALVYQSDTESMERLKPLVMDETGMNF